MLPGAGHQLAGPPGAPITTTTSPGPGVTFETGGDPAITTAARQETWHRTLKFLDLHLARPSRHPDPPLSAGGSAPAVFSLGKPER